MDMKRLIGIRTKSLRRARGLTQEELAERTGLSVNYLSRIERGLENPTLDTLLGLAKALKVEPLDLFTFEHEADPKRLRQVLDRLVGEIREDQLSQAVKTLRALIR